MGRALAFALLLLVPFTCTTSPPDRPEPLGDEESPLRKARVLIAEDAERVELRAESGISATDGDGAIIGSYPAHQWLTIAPGGEGTFRLGETTLTAEKVTLRLASAGCLTIRLEPGKKRSPPRCYPGTLQLVRTDEGLIDVVNSVDVEQYVACVVAAEVWPTFREEAFRAQAIVARTFLLYQMEQRKDAFYDVKATQSSQVYRGRRDDATGRRATRATKDTRGLTCTWRDGDRDRLFSTYYSAACGGRSQSAAIFGEADNVPPLTGGVKCDYCRIAPGKSYRWGPIRLRRDEVFRRLTSRYPELRSLGQVAKIEVIERTAADRPLRLRLTGSSGDTHDMLAEHFRLAMGGTVIRSTDCDIRLTRKHVIFENGRGFGHGLGLCQWGMQGQALEGKSAAEILRFYFPGSRITRVY